MKPLIPLLCGLIFGIGLTLSGMTQPAKVIGFLDLFGRWDPTLACVMGGAILVHLPVRQWAFKRSAPLYASTFETPIHGRIDGRLIIGAGLFGIGWGLAGYCPGPVVTAFLFSNDASVLLLGLVAGMSLYQITQPRTDTT